MFGKRVKTQKHILSTYYTMFIRGISKTLNVPVVPHKAVAEVSKIGNL
jgi:hypothetical protein